MAKAYESAPVIPLYPLEPNADLLQARITPDQPLPQFNIEISSISINPRRHEFKDGYFEDRRYTFSDGSSYDVQRFEPATRRYNIGVAYMTPWCTDLPGFNTEMGKVLAATGSHIVAIGPERSPFGRAARKLAKTMLKNTALLPHDAFTGDRIIASIEQERHVEPDIAMTVGYSRGGMGGNGLIAYGAAKGRSYVFNKHIDPCIERPVEKEDVPIRELPVYLALQEPVELVAALTEYSPKQLWRLRKTIQLHPSFVMNQIAVGVDLFRGPTGNFIANLPTHTALHVDQFSGSRFNQNADFAAAYKPFSNILVESHSGTHMTGMRKWVGERIVDFIVGAQEPIHAGDIPAHHLDVHALASRINRQYATPSA